MIVRFDGLGYRSADEDGGSFALQPRARPMPGWPMRTRVRPPKPFLKGFMDILSGDPLGVMSSGDLTDQYDPGQAAYGVSPDGSSGGSSPSTTDPWDPGQAAWGIPSSGGGSPSPTLTSSGGPSSGGNSSSGGGWNPASLLSLIGSFAPKPTATLMPVKTSIVLPVVLAVGGLGLVALLISSKKRA